MLKVTVVAAFVYGDGVNNLTDGEIVDSLDEHQRLAVVSNASRLCIVAAAGSGKTRVIVKRIEHLCSYTTLRPDQIVAITFTRKAGFELAQRLNRLFPSSSREKPFVGTLHSFVMSELHRYHEERRTRMKSILENPTELLGQLSIKNPRHVARAISWCKTRLIDITQITDDTMSSIRRAAHIPPRVLDKETFLEAWKKYAHTCSLRSLMDHDDVLLEYLQKLSDKSYADTRRYLYRHLFVDEFQDTTPLHMQIYRQLVGDTGSITVVGDPDQSIFSFAGASDVYLNNFTDFFPGSHVVFLSTNYRSTRANVEASRAVVTNSAHKDVAAPRSSMTLPQLHAYPDEKSEAENAIQIALSSHARGVKLSSIAILVRTNAQKELFRVAARALGVPINIGRVNSDDPVAAEVLATITSLRKKRRWRSIYDALDDISTLHEQGETTKNSDEAARKNVLIEMRKSAREYMDLFPHDRLGDIAGFFEFLTSQLTAHTSQSQSVALLTFHQAKGLEFSTVIVSGFENGLVPLYSDKKRKAEEARLAYVALSRAIDELHVTRARVRTLHGSPRVQDPSDFLGAIQDNIADLDIRNDIFSPQDAIKRIADIRAKYLIKKSSVKP